MDAKRVVVYARTSSDDEQGDSGSVDQQAADCVALSKQYGYQVLKTIKEPNRSGRLYPTGEPLFASDAVTQKYVRNFSPKTRDGLAELLDLLPEIDFIVVRDFTRLARPVGGGYLLNFLGQRLESSKVRIHSVVEGIKDLSNFQDRLVTSIQSDSVDAEVAKRRSLSIARLRDLTEAGFVNHCPNCYGYRTAGSQKVTVIEPEAKVVREIFKSAASGVASNQICKQLNADKVPGMNGAAVIWTVPRLLKILDRPEYFGHAFNSQRRLIVSKVYPAIIDDIKIFHTIQARRKANKRFPNKANAVEHPVSGSVVCGCCGLNLKVFHARQMLTNEKVYYYRCSSAYVRSKETNLPCRKSSFQEQQLVDLLKDFYKNLIDLPRDSESDDAETELVSIEAKRQTLLRREEDLFTGQDSFAVATFQRQSRMLANEIEKLEKQIKVLNEKVQFSSVPARFDRMYKPTAADLQQWIRSFFAKIVIHPYSVEFHMRDGSSFVLERIPERSQRNIPPVKVTQIEGSKGKKTRNFEIHYKNETPFGKKKVIYKAGGWSVTTIGSNPAPYEYAIQVRHRTAAKEIVEKLTAKGVKLN